jgi:hypothetical protein
VTKHDELGKDRVEVIENVEREVGVETECRVEGVVEMDNDHPPVQTELLDHVCVLERDRRAEERSEKWE